MDNSVVQPANCGDRTSYGLRQLGGLLIFVLKPHEIECLVHAKGRTSLVVANYNKVIGVLEFPLRKLKDPANIDHRQHATSQV